MAKPKEREIYVEIFFTGDKSGRDAFIDLILTRGQGNNFKSHGLDSGAEIPYTDGKVFSDVRVDAKENIA